MDKTVLYTVRDNVGVITLNRPDSLNALTTEMHQVLNKVFVQAYHDKSARVIVLTGAGRAFCAGADMERLDMLIGTRGKNFDIPRPGERPLPVFDGVDAPPELLNTYLFPMAMKKPVIAAVQGPCVGIALALAISCDVRFVSDSAFFSTPFAQLGLIAEFGLAWLLPRLVGQGVTNDILLSGRRVMAQEAVQVGLANRVVAGESLLDEAMAYARDIAMRAAPASTRKIKQQLLRAQSQSYAESTGEAWDLLMEALAQDDFIEGVNSFLEKRPSRFVGE